MSDEATFWRMEAERHGGSVTHLCPQIDDGGLMPCCGLTPFEVPRTDRAKPSRTTRARPTSVRPSLLP